MIELLADTLDQVERDCYENNIRPTENPRDLLTFARSMYLPPQRIGDPPEVYNPDGHLVQLLALREFENPRWRKFVIVACTQDGKSWIIQIVIFYFACELREAVVVGGPDMRIAQDTWRQKTRPAMIASGLGNFLPTSGPGSAGGSDVDTVQLHGGGLVMLLGAGGKNASGQAGRTSRAVIVDEFGKVKRALAGKFDRRADSYGEDGRIWKAGTVETDGDDTLLEAYEHSSKSRVVWRCHHCRQFTRLDWEQVSADYDTEFTAAESVRIACAKCGVNWTDNERRDNLRDGHLLHDGQEIDADGIITGPEPETYTCGILWSALDSPRRKLSILAIEYRNAAIEYEKGNAVPLQDFYNDQLARRAPVDDGSEKMDTVKLAARSAAATYTVTQSLNPDGSTAYQFLVGTLPAGVHFTTLAIDQSLRRLWYVLRGHNDDGVTWFLGWGRIPICGDLETPTEQQRFAALDKIRAIMAPGIPRTGGDPITPALIGLDCGEFPSPTFQWLAKNPGVLAIRGTGDRQFSGMTANMGREQYSEAGWYSLRTYDNDRNHREILWVDSDRVKTELSRALSRALDATGTAHLPHGLAHDNHLLAHLTSEQWLKAPGGRWTWVKKYRFNDLWDCGYYTQALGKYAKDRYPHLTKPDSRPSAPKNDDTDSGWGSNLGKW
jgi:hypothetical protein